MIFPDRISRKFQKISNNRYEKLKKRKKESLDEKDYKRYNSFHEQIHFEYSSKEELHLPTRFGNILLSAEQYSNERYGMDAAFWWPRLWPLLPEEIKTDIEESLTPVIALLNFALLIPIFSIIIWFWSFNHKSTFLVDAMPEFIVHLIPVILGFILAWIAYRSATLQAINYGTSIRAAIDLYRFNLLTALHQKPPKNQNEEEEIWKDLLAVLYMSDKSKIRDYYYASSKIIDGGDNQGKKQDENN